MGICLSRRHAFRPSRSSGAFSVETGSSKITQIRPKLGALRNHDQGARFMFGNALDIREFEACAALCLPVKYLGLLSDRRAT